MTPSGRAGGLAASWTERTTRDWKLIWADGKYHNYDLYAWIVRRQLFLPFSDN